MPERHFMAGTSNFIVVQLVRTVHPPLSLTPTITGWIPTPQTSAGTKKTVVFIYTRCCIAKISLYRS